MSEKRQTTLNTKEREKLKSFYGEEGQGHPLFLACNAAFIPRAGRLDEAMAEPEDIFFLVAGLLDYIFNRKAALSQHDVDSKFDSMVKSIRGWNNTSTNDRIVIADTVFRIARKLLCHHWNTYFSDEVFDMLTTTIDGKGVADREESDEFQSLLTNDSETLSEWINNGYTGRLSEEINDVIAEKSTGQTGRRGGRKAIDTKNITTSFVYLPKAEYREQRLQIFYQSLNRVFLAADQKDFIDMFSGRATTNKIVWIREIKELKYLLAKLKEKKWIEWTGNYTIGQMASARFQIRKKQKTHDSMTNDSFMIEDLTTRQLTDAKDESSHSELDRIISILDPSTDWDMLNLLQEQTNEKQSRVEDYKDALANGLNMSSHK